MEAIELEYPLRVEEYALIQDSGGAGRYRGGMGIRRAIRPVGHICEFNGVGERFKFKPWGLFGGEDGATGRFYLRHDDGSVKELASKASCIALDQATVAVMETAGAGGYGSPSERSAKAVLDDLQSEKFSKQFIESHYPANAKR